MYRRCIFCSGQLGANQSLEAFPVGRRVAFDAERGRLWAVCRRCGRWNLAPLEERWEPVEAAEKLFRDARLRVQSENVGLARLRDGTELVRVGRALPRELAAWRYGDTLARRQLWYVVRVVLFGFDWKPFAADLRLRVPSGGGQALVPVRPRELGHAHLEERDRDVLLHLPLRSGRATLAGAEARALLGRAMLVANRSGAAGFILDAAVDMVAEQGSAEAYIRHVARNRGALGSGIPGTQKLTPGGALALEIALHEEQERQAMEGELAALEAMWRQAEEIADIADRLPDGV